MSDLPETQKTNQAIRVEYDKLSDVQKMYVRRFERSNRKRAAEKSQLFSRLRKVGLTLVALSAGTYFYSIYAMRQIQLGPEFDQHASDFVVKDSKEE